MKPETALKILEGDALDELRFSKRQAVKALAAEVRRLGSAEREPKIHEVVAARVINNWDGEGDTCISLIYMDSDGTWIHHESGEPVFETVGDKIIEWWPLETGTGKALPTPISAEG